MKLRDIVQWGVIGCMPFLAACITPLPRETTFDQAQDNALLVTASRPTYMAARMEFRRVDLASKRFLPETVSIWTAGIDGNQIDRSSPIWLTMKIAEPGDYVVVEASTNTQRGYAWRCFFSGSPVYRLVPGKISVIPLNELWAGAPATSGGFWSSKPTELSGLNPDPSAIIIEFARVRQAYPGVLGEPTFIAPTAAIHWEQAKKGKKRYCSEPDEFVVDAGS